MEAAETPVEVKPAGPKTDSRFATHAIPRTSADAAKAIADRVEEKLRFVLAAAVEAFEELPPDVQFDRILAARKKFVTA